MVIVKRSAVAVIVIVIVIVTMLAAARIARGQASIEIRPGIPGSQNATSVPATVANFYQFALLAGGLLAFGAIVYGAVKYTVAAGNPSGQSDARDQITQALLGLLLLLGAYVVLFTINPNLTKLSLPELAVLNIPPPAGATCNPPCSSREACVLLGTGPQCMLRSSCSPPCTPPQVCVTPGTAGTNPRCETEAGATGGGGLSDAEARRQLTAAGVKIAAPSLAGTQQSVIDEVIRLKRSSGCAVQLNSTTSGGHSTRTACNHANGYKADVQRAQCVDSYVETAYRPPCSSRDNGTPRWRTGTATYARENGSPGHWDISVGGCAESC